MTYPTHPLINTDLEIMNGKPTIQGTRLTVELILELLAAGRSIEELLEDYPRLTPEGIQAALTFAADLIHQVASSQSEEAVS